MAPMTSFRGLLLSSVLAFAAGTNAAADWPQDVDVDSFVGTERGIALEGVLANIGPNGSMVPGAAAGLVVASPSKVNPDYFYTWTRDSALTLKMIVDEFLFGKTDLKPWIEDYITAQATLQTVKNPSGSLLPSGLGLGEPKFNVDGTKFNGNWGRPQRDGPALRSIAIITYSNYLIAQGESDRVKEVIWPIVSNDLSYTGQYWNSTGFDLWEEVSGSSFFTTQNQYRALVEGAKLASALGVTCTGCDQAPNVLCFLQTYWNGKYLTANINVNNGRTGIDANTMLGAISAFDVAAPCDSPTFQPCHSQSLASFKVFVDTFRNTDLYPINTGIPSTQGVALGRYPEDTYYNGNPWYLITLGAAEFLYDAVAQWSAQKSITVDTTSLPFFQGLYPNATATTYKQCKKSDPFRKILTAATAYADSFVAVAQAHTPSNGSLSEQFLKTPPGTPLSASALTWSFASFVTMAERRAAQYPPSWVPASLSQPPPPSSCQPGSTKGVYAPATAAGAPNVTVGCTSTVLFEVNATTYYGENVYLLGNASELGAWDIDDALPMLASNYSSERPLWYLAAPLPAGETVSYVYVRQEDCGQPWIYESVNRTVVVPACVEGDESVRETTDDAWTGATGSSGGC